MTRPSTPGQPLVLAALGTQVALRVLASADAAADEELCRRLRTAWSRCAGDPQAPTAEEVRVRVGQAHPDSPADDGEVTSSDDVDQMMVITTQLVTRALIRARAGELLMLHAGSVCHPTTGEALVYIAPGGTGKSTLTRTLGQRYGYLTDETVGITRERVILPYPKPLSMRREGLPKDELSPDACGMVSPAATPRVRKLVLLRRDPELGSPHFEPLDLFEAIIGMVPESSSLSRLDRGLHALADLIGATGGAECWTYGEHTHLLPRIESLLGTP